MIDFADSRYLLLLLVVAAMAGVAVWLLRWRQQARESFAGPQAAAWPASPFALRLGLVLAAAALVAVAAARPQWGSNERVRERQGVDLVIVLDISASMQATDVPPTRMGFAQDELVKLVEAQRGSRHGLVLFAGTSILRSPLSTDTLAISQLIRRADREAGLTRAGSNIGLALEQATRILDASETPGKAVIIVSDGEDHNDVFVDRARALREKGIAVYTVGVGTPAGGQLFDVDARGQARPKLDAAGRPVISRLDEAKMRSIAENGGGRYLAMDGTGPGLISLRDDLAHLEQTPLAADTQELPIERYQPFVIAALILLAEAWLLPGRVVMPSLRRIGRARPHPGLALIAVALLAGACAADPLRQDNAAANQLYDDGKYDEALSAYERLLAQRPDVLELSVNAGNTLHRLGNYERAVGETQRALPPVDVKLGSETYYALGNHQLALEDYEGAYEAYKAALLLNPKDGDAKHNLEVVLARLTGSRPGNQQQGPGPGEGQPGQQGQPGPSQGQPGNQTDPSAPPGPAGDQPGQGQPSQNPPPPPPSGADIRRQLQDALRGIDEDVSFEEALRILDLLREQQNQQRGPDAGRTTGPDY